MRWIVKEPGKVVKPDKRYKFVIKFAWLPLITNDAKKIWLEKYLAKYELRKVYFSHPGLGGIYDAHDWRLLEAWSQDTTLWKEYNGKL